jgi:hypothetical protein
MKSHPWLAVALERYQAGEPEQDVMEDYGYVRFEFSGQHSGCRVNEKRYREEIERLKEQLTAYDKTYLHPCDAIKIRQENERLRGALEEICKVENYSSGTYNCDGFPVTSREQKIARKVLEGSNEKT